MRRWTTMIGLALAGLALARWRDRLLGLALGLPALNTDRVAVRRPPRW